MSPEELAARCQSVATMTEQAIDWLQNDANQNLVGRERDALCKIMRKAGNRARRLERASIRPMCVGVFGPSQAGKSYLVEVLARPENGTLRARFDGMEPVEFLTQINPIGEKESTGLVTRFTVRSSPNRPPAGFPVRLRLLSEIDIIKILGNTFFHDGDQTKEVEIPIQELEDVFARLSRRTTAQGSMTEEDFGDLQEYFQKHFGREPLMSALERLWVDGPALLPKLDIDGRAELFSLIWGKHQPFTDLYKSLAKAIATLGYVDEAYAPMEALIPREGSILDVATLTGLGNQTESELEIKNGQGASVRLARPLVAAMTAELCIEVTECPRPLFNDTDLLDFPGARSRQKIHLQAFFSEKPDALKETFLRGKVAYLFDRYVAEQELTSMLLCIRPSIMEVVTLPNLISDWIDNTHGKTPEARQAHRNLLFLVLTWFDTHFIDKAGDIDDGGLRFRNRIDASLLGFFGKAHSWPHKWSPNQPFNNSYWFRNPNYPADSIIRYEGRREVEFLPNKVQRINELRAGFLSIPEANAHFRDPAKSFDEALKLNDGGIGYLAERLAEVCLPEVKLDQIIGRLNELCADLHRSLARFYVSLDLEKRLEERRAAADKVYESLAVAVENRRFGSLLRELLIDPIDLTNAIQGVLQAPSRSSASNGVAQPVRVQRIISPRGGAPKDNASPGFDRETLLARAAIQYWTHRSRRLLSDSVQLDRLGLTPEIAKEIVEEILALSRRVKLEQQIVEDLRLFLAFERPEESGVKSSLIASSRINRMMGDLGFRNVPENLKPEVSDGTLSRRAFGSRPITFDASGLTDEPKPFTEEFATDWFHAFDHIVTENAKSEQGVTVDLVQNANLKAILDGLQPITQIGA